MERLVMERYPCGVCGSGVGANSVLCRKCGKWCHWRCSGLKSLSAAAVVHPTSAASLHAKNLKTFRG